MNTSREKIYVLIALLSVLMVLYLAWDRYRTQVVLAQCRDAAEHSTHSFERSSLPGSEETKSYDILLNECLDDFGF